MDCKEVEKCLIQSYSIPLKDSLRAVEEQLRRYQDAPDFVPTFLAIVTEPVSYTNNVRKAAAQQLKVYFTTRLNRLSKPERLHHAELLHNTVLNEKVESGIKTIVSDCLNKLIFADVDGQIQMAIRQRVRLIVDNPESTVFELEAAFIFMKAVLYGQLKQQHQQECLQEFTALCAQLFASSREVARSHAVLLSLLHLLGSIVKLVYYSKQLRLTAKVEEQLLPVLCNHTLTSSYEGDKRRLQRLGFLNVLNEVLQLVRDQRNISQARKERLQVLMVPVFKQQLLLIKTEKAKLEDKAILFFTKMVSTKPVFYDQVHPLTASLAFDVLIPALGFNSKEMEVLNHDPGEFISKSHSIIEHGESTQSCSLVARALEVIGDNMDGLMFKMGSGCLHFIRCGIRGVTSHPQFSHSRLGKLHYLDSMEVSFLVLCILGYSLKQRPDFKEQYQELMPECLQSMLLEEMPLICECRLIQFLSYHTPLIASMPSHVLLQPLTNFLIQTRKRVIQLLLVDFFENIFGADSAIPLPVIQNSLLLLVEDLSLIRSDEYFNMVRILVRTHGLQFSAATLSSVVKVVVLLIREQNEKCLTKPKGSSHTLIALCNIVEQISTLPLLVEKHWPTIEPSLLPLFQQLVAPQRTLYRDNLVQVAVNVVTHSRDLSKGVQVVASCVPALFQCNGRKFEQLFVFINKLIGCAKNKLLQTNPQFPKLVIELAVRCIAHQANQISEATQGVLLLHLVLIVCPTCLNQHELAVLVEFAREQVEMRTKRLPGYEVLWNKLDGLVFLLAAAKPPILELDWVQRHYVNAVEGMQTKYMKYEAQLFLLSSCSLLGQLEAGTPFTWLLFKGVAGSLQILVREEEQVSDDHFIDQEDDGPRVLNQEQRIKKQYFNGLDEVDELEVLRSTVAVLKSKDQLRPLIARLSSEEQQVLHQGLSTYRVRTGDGFVRRKMVAVRK